jgi:hypothetical protein
MILFRRAGVHSSCIAFLYKVAAAGKDTRGSATSDRLKAKVARMSETPVAEGEHEASAHGKEVKPVRKSRERTRRFPKGRINAYQVYSFAAMVGAIFAYFCRIPLAQASFNFSTSFSTFP